MCCLNNSFHYLNNITHIFTTRIFTTLFHLHVFSQHLNNVTRTTLKNVLLMVGTWDPKQQKSSSQCLAKNTHLTQLKLGNSKLQNHRILTWDKPKAFFLFFSFLFFFFSLSWKTKKKYPFSTKLSQKHPFSRVKIRKLKTGKLVSSHEISLIPSFFSFFFLKKFKYSSAKVLNQMLVKPNHKNNKK